jgi:hemoglobin-like flavoprotein
MTPAQIRTIRASFTRIEPVLSQLGSKFYARLFVVAPALRPLFEEDLSFQQAKFMKVVSELVNLHLRSLLTLPAVGGKASIPALVELGRVHGTLGVRMEHFEVMRIALIQALGDEMGEDFTPAISEAWQAAFDVLAGAMQEGLAAGASETGERFLQRLPGDHGGDAVEASSDSGFTQFFGEQTAPAN